VAGYNGQLVVTARQVIVGAMLSQHPVDRTLLHPLLDTCRQQLARAGIDPRLRTVLADSGYVSEENFARADDSGLRLLAPLAKDPARRRVRAPQQARNLDRLPATARAVRRLRHPRGQDDYRMRGPHRGTSLRAPQDLPETDHDVPPRPSRVRKRMAARMRRAQSAEAAPAPRGRLTVKDQSTQAKPQDRPRPELRTYSCALRSSNLPSTRLLCDRLKYPDRPTSPLSTARILLKTART
jgi:hypothetical protein